MRSVMLPMAVTSPQKEGRKNVFTYNEICKAMKNYSELSKVEREIIELLIKEEEYFGYAEFYGSATALTFALKRPKSHVSNVCKALKSLEEKGLVLNAKGKERVYFLNVYWVTDLIKGEE